MFGIKYNNMPDSKISNLTELAEAPASTDELVIVDKSDTTMAASGTTKRITTANALASKLNTADFDTQLATEIHGATGKTTPVDADEIGLIDSAASFILKKLTWANLKATILAYFTDVTTTWSNKTLTSPVIGAITNTDHITITPGTSKLVKLAVLRQDDTTDTYKNNSVILTGWGWILGDGTSTPNVEAVTFGITFSEIPIVVSSVVGQKNGSHPSNIGDSIAVSSSANMFIVGNYGLATTGFNLTFGKVSVDGNAVSALANTVRYMYSWIAIGQLN